MGAGEEVGEVAVRGAAERDEKEGERRGPGSGPAEPPPPPPPAISHAKGKAGRPAPESAAAAAAIRLFAVVRTKDTWQIQPKIDFRDEKSFGHP